MRCYWPALTILLTMIACGGKKEFNGSGPTGTQPAASSQDGSPNILSHSMDASAAGVSDCVFKDQLVIAWEGPAKACFDQGKLFDFENQRCVEIKKASFSCDWATVQGKLEEKGLLTETIKKDASEGAKLISCGQSGDENRIAIQWVKLAKQPNASCSSIKQGGGITTGCYQYYPNSMPPPATQSQDELRQRVASCLKDL